MDKQLILEAITNIKTLEDLSSWDLQTILADFPFFQTAHLLWAKKAMDTDNYEQQEILQKTAIYAGNRAVLYKLLYQKETISSLDEVTLQIDTEDLPIILPKDSTELDGQETEIVAINHLNLPEEEDVTESITLPSNLGFLGDNSDTSLNEDTEALEEGMILDKLKAEIAEKQKSIELELKEKKEDFSKNIPATPTSIDFDSDLDEKLEETARSITSSIDKSLLKIAQQEEVSVEKEEVRNMPATQEIIEAYKQEEEDKFALKHIFEKQEGEKDDYLNTEQISEEARKQVQEQLSAKLKSIGGDIEVPIIESSNTADLSDLVKKEVKDTIQKDIEELEGKGEDIWEEEEDMRVNSAIIRASIEEDKESLKGTFLEHTDDNIFIEEGEEEAEHPENEIESDLIKSLKAKVDSYKQKKKTFESWLTGGLEKEERPKVKLSEEDETEIKKFVDLQSEMNKGEKTLKAPVTNETSLEGTESMAEVYAQQGHYKRAVKIYEQLSLKYPEKSGYFVGKIVELQKKL
ncbi:MAG: hypothetical protein ACPG49_07405 [Chitinophagales bacterium]